jgi:hypothetical protein
LAQLAQQADAEPANMHQLQMMPANDGGYVSINTAIAGTQHVAAAPDDRRTWAIHLQLGKHHRVHKYTSKRMQFKSYKHSQFSHYVSVKQALDELEVTVTHVA